MDVRAIPYEAVDDMWPVVEPWLVRAAHMQDSVYDADDIKEAIHRGDLALWVIFDGPVPVATFTTRVTQTPKVRVMSMDWVGGTRMSEWLDDAMEMIERYARDMGCTRLEGGGRKGWVNALSKHGWKQKVSVMKELT